MRPSRIALAVVAAVVCAASLGLGAVNGFLGLIAGAIVAFILLRYWFDLDLFGAIVVVVIYRVVELVLGAMVLAAMLSVLHRLGA